MGILDSLTDRHFSKDDSGRLAFLPRGPSRPAYFVGSTDTDKIKSLVKIYIVASVLFNLTGATASIAITQWLTFDERSASLAHRLKFGAVVYAISATLLYFGPAVLLWSVYRRAVDRICASLTVVDRASVHLTPLPSSSRRAVFIGLGAAFLLLAIGILALVSPRR